jgi:branched-chain amino acid transport system permease protein
VSADFIQLLVGGILLGGIYGLAAFGLSITFGVLNVLNLAHGEFLMLGSLLSYGVFVGLGINPFLAAVLVIPVFMLLGSVFICSCSNPSWTSRPINCWWHPFW